MRIKHHFSTDYCSRFNGTVAHECKEVLRIKSSLMSVLKIFDGQWPAIANVAHGVINELTVGRLGKNDTGNLQCPMEVFLGLKPNLHLLLIYLIYFANTVTRIA